MTRLEDKALSLKEMVVQKWVFDWTLFRPEFRKVSVIPWTSADGRIRYERVSLDLTTMQIKPTNCFFEVGEIWENLTQAAETIKNYAALMDSELLRKEIEDSTFYREVSQDG